MSHTLLFRQGVRFHRFGYWILGIGYQVSGIGYRVSGIGCQVLGIWYWVSGIGYRGNQAIGAGGTLRLGLGEPGPATGIHSPVRH